MSERFLRVSELRTRCFAAAVEMLRHPEEMGSAKRLSETCKLADKIMGYVVLGRNFDDEDHEVQVGYGHDDEGQKKSGVPENIRAFLRENSGDANKVRTLLKDAQDKDVQAAIARMLNE